MKNCPKIKHKYGEDDDMICDGIPHAEFDYFTVCEYQTACLEVYNRYEGVSFKSKKHPWSFKWWLKTLFRRPKFSASALEPAEKIIEDRYKMILDHEEGSKSTWWGLSNPDYSPCHCESCEKKAFIEMVKLVEKNFGRDSLNYDHPMIKKYLLPKDITEIKSVEGCACSACRQIRRLPK